MSCYKLKALPLSLQMRCYSCWSSHCYTNTNKFLKISKTVNL